MLFFPVQTSIAGVTGIRCDARRIASTWATQMEPAIRAGPPRAANVPESAIACHRRGSVPGTHRTVAPGDPTANISKRRLEGHQGNKYQLWFTQQCYGGGTFLYFFNHNSPTVFITCAFEERVHIQHLHGGRTALFLTAVWEALRYLKCYSKYFAHLGRVNTN